jgi:hypothetical protein
LIKINLSRTRIQEGEMASSHLETPSSVGGQGGASAILVRLVLMFGGVFALNYYESTNIERLTNELSVENQAVATLQQTLSEKQAELQSFDSSEQESKALQDKISLLKNLSQLRLREVKSLDFIQTILPVRVWLTALSIEKEKFVIKGGARDVTGVSSFVAKLEDGGYFSDVVLIKDSPIQKDGIEMREFEVVARSEVSN